MNLLGIHLTVLIGPTVPLPAPPLLLETLESVAVIHSDQGRAGFQLTLRGPVCSTCSIINCSACQSSAPPIALF